MYRLPTKVTVDDLEFNIRERGDFRMVLDCFKALQDEELSEDYRVLASLLIFYNEFNDFDDLREYESILNDLVKEMFEFINGGEETSPGAERDVALVDWEQDSQLVCAAINNVANQEIRSVEYMHWWTFLGAYMEIGEGLFSNIIHIRQKKAKGKKLEKWEQEFYKENKSLIDFQHKEKRSNEEKEMLRDYFGYSKK